MTRETQPWREWRHVVKLDPDRTLPEELFAALATSGTDAVFIGGTQGITYAKVEALLRKLRQAAPDLPVWQEISESDAVVEGMDGYAVPVVLNSGSPKWLIGAHTQAMMRYRPLIDWSQVLVEGYVVLNGEAAVAKLTEADTELSSEDAVAYAVTGEALFSLPAIYLEYSGTYGDPALVADVCCELRGAHVFYGGGIHDYSTAAEMARHADTIIVGNALYETNGVDVLRETVRAARET
ncbi:MAG: geranylgeranylglyceryl/heptaprenylglyceryl phosphate synthase [Tumebacillaceae bacterium]